MKRIGVVEVMEAAAEGTARHVLGLVRGLDPARFEVTLVASTRRRREFAGEMEQLRREGVRCFEVRMEREIRPWADARATLQLTRLLKQLQPDVVHGHAGKGGFVGRAAARLARVRHTVYTPHCFAFLGDVSAAKRRLYREAERRAGRWTSRLVAVSRWEAQLAAKERIVPPEKVVTIPNGLSPADWEQVTPSDRLKEELGIPTGSRVVGFVGRLWRQKGADVLVRALARMRETEDVRLLMVGDGPERKSIERLVRDRGLTGRVTFAGFHPDVKPYLALMHVMVFPSRWESLPYAVMEAMARGGAIVATDVGGLPELLDGGRCAVLVGRDDEAGIARAVRDLLTDEKKRSALGAAARDRVMKEYVEQRSVERTARLYQELTSEEA